MRLNNKPSYSYRMMKWLREYDRLRTNPDAPNESWISTKYDIIGLTWKEISDIYILELEMCWGPACSALRKTWYKFKMAGKEGTDYRGDIAYRINKIQDGMGIPLTDFEEYPGIYQSQDNGNGYRAYPKNR